MASGGDRVQRKLAAIFAADVAGYSRLMRHDEVRTLRILTAHRDVMDKLIRKHGGRIANTAGDSVLAEFPSVVDAVECAVEVQTALGRLNSNDPAQHRLQFRIGIHVGDVMVRGNDLLGDGVNVAARLESLAEPGGVCLSDDAYRHVRNDPSLRFANLGAQQVKNIDEPIQAFAVFASEGEPVAETSKSLQTKAALPERPSIAVLPFTNMSSDPEHAYFAEGMTEDITTGLSRLGWLFVIGRSSTAAYRNKTEDVRQVARDLGVRYVLEGSVRTSASRMRVTSQLIEAETRNHIWTEKYDRKVADIFDLQDEITASVVAAIEPHLYRAEGMRAMSQPPEKITSWGLVVRAIGLINSLGRGDNEEARSLLERATTSEPSYAKAHAVLSWAVWWAAFNYWLPDEHRGREQAQRHANDALALDPREPWARMVRGLCLSSEGQHDAAMRELRVALEVNPSFALAHTMYGWSLLRAGRFAEAVDETSAAFRLSPADAYLSLYESIHGLALLAARRFEDALPYIRKAIVAFPDFAGHHTLLISCYGHLGLIDEAKSLLPRRNALGPRLTVSLIRQQLRDHAHGPIMAEGLSKAGIPEE